MSKLSVIVPIFNEEGNLDRLVTELFPILDKLKYFSSYEIIAVNDGSRDNSLYELKKLAAADEHIKIISFTRNFGHECATTAGLRSATGDALVIIDADLQDPPELIFDFEREWKNGYDIVYGQRSKRLQESWFKKLTSKLFYPIFSYVTKLDMPHDVGDFCLLSRKTIDIIKNMPERSIFIRGLIYWTGLPKKAVPFIRRQRQAGTSKYNYFKLTIFALENIISFSTTPIYYLIFLSLFAIAACSVGTLVALVMHFMGRVVMTGWTSLIICIFGLFSLTFFVLGILGLYIGKIFHEIKQRPPFLVDEYINFDNQHTSKDHQTNIPLHTEKQAISHMEK